MQSTLIYIPHSDPWWGVSIFGFGWLLAVWAVAGTAVTVRSFLKYGWSEQTRSYLPALLIVGAIIYWVVPALEDPSAAGPPLGVPIRAYGIMLLLGIVCGVGLTTWYARRLGIEPDVIFSMVFWMILLGFIGARAFYVIEYWEKFSRDSLLATLSEIANVAEGGLVVYGSFVGGVLGLVLYVRHRRLPLLAMCDLLAPGMMLGLALGRIGCLMNGCCWGGLCADAKLSINFPPGSPPFMHQLEHGLLVGMELERAPGRRTLTVKKVTPGGLAERQGLKVGDQVAGIDLPTDEQLNRMRSGQTVGDAMVSFTMTDGRRVSWEFRQLPRRSRRVYPAQILSSINAALICCFLCAYYPFRRRDGEIVAWMVSIYPVTRILLEMIRTDEPSVLPTEFKLTISQAVSGLLLLLVLTLWAYVLSRPRGSALGSPTAPAAPGPPGESSSSAG